MFRNHRFAIARAQPLAKTGFPSWMKPILLGGFALGVLWIEKRRPLRTQVESKLRHDVRNVGVATLSAMLSG